jgi:hypothetical protein
MRGGGALEIQVGSCTPRDSEFPMSSKFTRDRLGCPQGRQGAWNRRVRGCAPQAARRNSRP